jgi:hypothetical protein
MEHMTDRWTESLSEYLDGELAPEDRRELGLHLESCSDCRSALGELERIVERARALPDQAPPRDLWPGIEARIGAHRAHGAPTATAHSAEPVPLPQPKPAARRRAPTRVVSFTWPQLVAAGLTIALLATAAFWLGTRGDQRLARHNTAKPGASDTRVATAPNQNESSEEAIVELKDALARGRETLDPATVKVLEQNLSTIERSIHEAKTALDADPANPYLRRHLQETMTSKMNLIRQATYLASAP